MHHPTGAPLRLNQVVPPGFERIDPSQVGTLTIGGPAVNAPVPVGIGSHLVTETAHHLVQPTANHLVQTVPVAAVPQPVVPQLAVPQMPAHPQPLPSHGMQFANYSLRSPIWTRIIAIFDVR